MNKLHIEVKMTAAETALTPQFSVHVEPLVADRPNASAAETTALPLNPRTSASRIEWPQPAGIVDSFRRI